MYSAVSSSLPTPLNKTNYMKIVFWNNYTDLFLQEFILINVSLRSEEGITCLSIGFLGFGIGIGFK